MLKARFFTFKSLLLTAILLYNFQVFNTAETMQTNLPIAADRIRNEPESVWVEFIQLALDNNPLNLGQGFPDFAAPQYLIESLHNATLNKPELVLNNQYTRSFGHPRLVKALSKYYRNFRSFDKLENPNEQVIVTVGAYEALFTSIMAFVNPGDEVLLVDPAFDAYKPMVEMAQGIVVCIPLRLKHKEYSSKSNGNATLSSSDYVLDMDEFEGKIKPNKTKVLVLNTPNNPLGKIYSKIELESIAKLCIKYNILVIADEVYEQMYYAPEATHISIASMPNMWDRTITIGSAGKTFSVTGWKIGWAFGPKSLISYVQLVHQTAIYTVATPLQEAIARALENEIHLLSSKHTSYWHGLRSDLREKRDKMASILSKAKMNPIVPQGGYFMLADFSSLARIFPEYIQKGQPDSEQLSTSNDYLFARWLSRSKKLQGIPASAFYSANNKKLAQNMIRFCFIKQNSTLDSLEILIDNLTLETKAKL